MEESESSDYQLHDHPLIYVKGEQKSSCCSACGLLLSSTTSYKCDKQGCNFFLHKACSQLPLHLEYVSADQGVLCNLNLDVRRPSEQNWTCDKCGELCENLITYFSNNDQDNAPPIYVHALCAFPLKIEHDSHEHELVAMHREALLLCDVCGQKQKGFFFSCKDYLCDFWIHKKCAELARIIGITSHPRPLTLSYSAFGKIFSFDSIKNRECIICEKKFSHKAAYYCQQCHCVAHLHCAISAIIKKDPGYRPVQLPLEEADKSVFITMIDKKRIIEKNKEDDHEKLSIDKYHNHPNLTLFHDNIIGDKDYSSSSSNYYSLQCNACIQPIDSPPFYGCQEPGCGFLLHKHCTNLPSEINPKFLFSTEKSSPLKLKSKGFFSIFDCHFCEQRCNGFGYEFDIHDYLNLPSQICKVDVEIASIPRTIKHQLHHRQHILYLISISNENLPFVCCSAKYDWPTFFVYKCSSCNFMIHTKCALLPTKVSHKFDKHPLQLSQGCTNVNIGGEDNCFCENCEGHINTKFWFYHCMECKQFFHVKCIPSVGVLSKIKFGGNLVIPCHPSDHPVTLMRMLNIGNQRCGKCKKIIQGFRDDMTFQCSKCCYWIHFDCAKEALMLIRD